MKRQRKKSDINMWPIPAGLFIGIGVGLITEQIWGFALIGFGLGLFIAYLNLRKKK